MSWPNYPTPRHVRRRLAPIHADAGYGKHVYADRPKGRAPSGAR